MSVTVWTYPGFWEPPEGAVRALEPSAIGRASGEPTDLEAYIAKVTDKKTRGVQAGVIGWYGSPDRPAPPRHLRVRLARSQLLLRPAHRRPDRAGARAAGHRPGPRAALWARIERDIVDLAHSPANLAAPGSERPAHGGNPRPSPLSPEEP